MLQKSYYIQSLYSKIKNLDIEIILIRNFKSNDYLHFPTIFQLSLQLS